MAPRMNRVAIKPPKFLENAVQIETIAHVTMRQARNKLGRTRVINMLDGIPIVT